MTYPEVQFVAAPEDGAAVLFDFNDNIPGEAPAQIVAGTFTLGTPSLVGDPDGLGVQYGPREVGFTLLIFGNRQAAKETQALLARTFMLRRRGWLRVKMDDYSSPVWLRTYTPTPAELDFSLISPDSAEDAWQLEVTVAAEPFIRGERIDLWSGTINNNPAATTNPMGVTLPAVVGDAPAPLRITAEFNRTHNQSDILWATSAVPSGHAPIVWQIGAGDTWEAGFDTNAPEFDASFSGGSYRRVVFTVSTGMDSRLAGTAPTSVPPGRYRVLLRVGRDSTSGTFAFRLGYRTDYNGDVFGGSKVAVLDRGLSSSPVYATWVDLGDFDFPISRGAIDLPETASAPKIALQAQRLTGSANVVLDAFLLIPVDLASVPLLEPWEKSDLLVSEFPGQGPQAIAGETQVWDGDSEASLRVSPSGMVDASVGASSRGQFPTIRPGHTNRLTLVQQTRLSSGLHGTDNNTDAISDSASVTVSYQPRWLYLGNA